MARLNLRTGRAAKHPTGKRGGEGVKPVREDVERLLLTPSPTTIHANIEFPSSCRRRSTGALYSGAGATGRSAACAPMHVTTSAVAAAIEGRTLFMAIISEFEGKFRKAT